MGVTHSGVLWYPRCIVVPRCVRGITLVRVFFPVSFIVFFFFNLSSSNKLAAIQKRTPVSSVSPSPKLSSRLSNRRLRSLGSCSGNYISCTISIPLVHGHCLIRWALYVGVIPSPNPTWLNPTYQPNSSTKISQFSRVIFEM